MCVCVCVCVGGGGGDSGLCVIVDRFEGDRRSLAALHLNSSLMSTEPLKLINHVLCNLCLRFKISSFYENEFNMRERHW